MAATRVRDTEWSSSATIAPGRKKADSFQCHEIYILAAQSSGLVCISRWCTCVPQSPVIVSDMHALPGPMCTTSYKSNFLACLPIEISAHRRQKAVLTIVLNNSWFVWCKSPSMFHWPSITYETAIEPPLLHDKRSFDMEGSKNTEMSNAHRSIYHALVCWAGRQGNAWSLSLCQIACVLGPKPNSHERTYIILYAFWDFLFDFLFVPFSFVLKVAFFLLRGWPTYC